MPRKKIGFIYCESLKANQFDGAVFAHSMVDETRKGILLKKLGDIRGASTDKEAIEILEGFALGIIQNYADDLKRLREIDAKKHKGKAQGGKNTAQNRPETKAYKQARAMWFDWYIGNKQAYAVQGKTHKTALATTIIERLETCVIDGVAYDFSEMSRAHLMQKFRDWENELKEQLAFQRCIDTVTDDTPQNP